MFLELRDFSLCRSKGRIRHFTHLNLQDSKFFRKWRGQRTSRSDCTWTIVCQALVSLPGTVSEWGKFKPPEFLWPQFVFVPIDHQAAADWVSAQPTSLSVFLAFQTCRQTGWEKRGGEEWGGEWEGEGRGCVFMQKHGATGVWTFVWQVSDWKVLWTKCKNQDVTSILSQREALNWKRLLVNTFIIVLNLWACFVLMKIKLPPEQFHFFQTNTITWGQHDRYLGPTDRTTDPPPCPSGTLHSRTNTCFVRSPWLWLLTNTFHSVESTWALELDFEGFPGGSPQTSCSGHGHVDMDHNVSSGHRRVHLDKVPLLQILCLQE